MEEIGNLAGGSGLAGEEERTADAGTGKAAEKLESKILASESGKIDEIPEAEAPAPETAAAPEAEAPAPEIAAAPEAETLASGKEKKMGGAAEVLSWVRDIAIAVVLAIIISQFITPTIVQEHSMDDTLHNDDYLILWKGGFKMGHSPQYGDIVVFRSNVDNEETGKKKLLIKRVIAVGGDTVSISGGVVYRNGEALYEPYTKDGYTNGGMDDTVVPDGTLFLLGDNRLVSLDSRSEQVGFVDEDALVGKAVFRLFPFSDAGGLYENLPDGQ